MTLQSLGKWCVVDEESMSTEPNAALYSIGATMIDDLEVVDRFYINIEPQTCLDVGLDQSESTMNWWAQQGAAAQDVLTKGRVPLKIALQMWHSWISKHGGRKVRLMGNGPCADNMWLNSAFKALKAHDTTFKLDNPVPYWNDIDHRTLNWIGGAWLGVTKEDVTFKGIKHHAGDDAEHEALHALLVLKAVREALTNTGTLTNTGATSDMNKQEFILNTVADAVRAGTHRNFVELADQLAQVYEISGKLGEAHGEKLGTVNGLKQLLGMKESDTDTALFSRVEALLDDTSKTLPHPTNAAPYVDKLENGVPTAPVVTDTLPNPPVTDVPLPNADATESTPVQVATESTPTAHTDDWGLEHSADWHTSNRSVLSCGAFKRKPGTNEEDYAKWLAERVAEAQAAGTFKGPDDWAKELRLVKYLDPIEVLPEPADVPTLQPVAETVPQATYATTTAPAAVPEPKPLDEVREKVAAMGASEAAANTVTSKELMTSHMAVVGAFEFFKTRDTRALAALDVFHAANIMQIPDDKKTLFLAMEKAILDNIDTIKADPTYVQGEYTGDILKAVLDSVTA